ncbi:FUN14 family-domain-containing protein [Helicostylum pulchrum]|uniref:FUN14 family protein n=1 Tax=Helicostylum pulchrum TaxID=562976 RepID=A0ABP9YGS4_9FUNG|nr:FUN14 family-domain-containing protein [Helicostylum pulchrum]
MLRLPRVVHTVKACKPNAFISQQTRQFSLQNKQFFHTPVKTVIQNHSKALGASKIVALAAFSSASPLLFKKSVECQGAFAQPSTLHTTLDKSIISPNKSIINKGELTFGTFLGVCTGFLVKKVGKLFAAFIGTGFVFLQYLSQQGYVTVNWERLEGGYNKALDLDRDGKVSARDLQTKWQKFVNILTSNIQFKSTFLIGFYAGLRYG